jgi:hypothetical protein
MPSPLVSVIIPAFNGREVIGEAVSSVLHQTYPHFELVVVDDHSSDGCGDLVEGLGDRRIRVIRHSDNRGAQAARRTGLEGSGGEVVFFLDQDDRFHPRKLERHVAYMEAHPEVGLTYNPHFAVLHPMGWVVGIWRPPARITLADLVLGFPLPPSVWVMRRSWALRDELYNGGALLRGAEAVICGRLLVAGCRFAMVDQVLNYRRHHVARRFADPVAKCREERRCQDLMIDDPRSSPATASLRDAAHVGNYLVWTNVALAQGDATEGRALLEEALRLDPGIAVGRPSPLAHFVVSHALLEAVDPEAQVRIVLGQIGERLPAVGAELEWAAATAHVLRAGQHLTWERPAEAAPHVERAGRLGWRADDYCCGRLSYELLCHELEFGRRAARDALHALVVSLQRLDGTVRRRLETTYPLARAFHAHGQGALSEVPRHVLRAFLEYPACARNRGAWSILGRSMVTSRRRRDATAGLQGAMRPGIGPREGDPGRA